MKGKHLIAGQWLSGDSRFSSSPATGEPHEFWNGTIGIVNKAAEAAHVAFTDFGSRSRRDRARFLDEVAAELERRAEDIVAIAASESGLPNARLEGELGRTAGQLRLFSQHVLDGNYLEPCVVEAQPDRQPIPRPDLRLMMRPIGPVAVFGASNFPLAFSAAGGDTASALAAGCPVVVKGHPAHPGTSERVADAVLSAARTTGMPDAVFSLIQDAGHDVARSLVQHPRIKAVGFTGSLAAGRSLFDLCAGRPEPIPFFGELGSINPGFVLPNALARRGADIASGWVGSLTLGAGQFCTRPGVLFLPDVEGADAFVDAAVAALQEVPEQTMLTDGIAASYRRGAEKLDSMAGVSTRFLAAWDGRSALPSLFETQSATWREHKSLAEEVFGPLGLVVRVSSIDEIAGLAEALDGQLTATMHLDEGDGELAAELLPILEQKAGRLLANSFPTGVEVSPAMMHGGPYPASTNVAATSVGTLAMRRFLKPVCYQNMPPHLLPRELRV